MRSRLELRPLPYSILTEFGAGVDVFVEIKPNFSTSGFKDNLRSEVKPLRFSEENDRERLFFF